MTFKLPPLHALRAFVVAGRHVSFKAAAAELNVTPGAVSQHIKTLEANLGVQLFERVHRGLRLTPAGAAYLPALVAAFEQMVVATERLVHTQDKVIVVDTTPSFAAAWLVPRLGRFQRRHPDLEVRVTTSVQLAAFVGDGVDLAIRHCRGEYPGLRSDRLFSSSMSPVCAPELLRDGTPPREPRDLCRYPLLHESERRDWRLWFECLGVRDVAVDRGPGFDSEFLVLQAAIAGQGVAMLRDVLVAGAIAEGRLVRALDVSWPSRFAYYLVMPVENGGPRHKLAAFRQWLLDEARAAGGGPEAEVPRPRNDDWAALPETA